MCQYSSEIKNKLQLFSHHIIINDDGNDYVVVLAVKNKNKRAEQNK